MYTKPFFEHNKLISSDIRWFFAQLALLLVPFALTSTLHSHIKINCLKIRFYSTGWTNIEQKSFSVADCMYPKMLEFVCTTKHNWLSAKPEALAFQWEFSGAFHKLRHHSLGARGQKFRGEGFKKWGKSYDTGKGVVKSSKKRCWRTLWTTPQCDWSWHF